MGSEATVGEKSEVEPEVPPPAGDTAPAETAPAAAEPQVQAVIPGADSGAKKTLLIAAALLMLAAAAAATSVALYCSSRSAFRGEQRAAFEDLQQSLQRMEQRMAASEARAGRAAAGDRGSNLTADGPGLLDAANLRYREGQFQEAAASFRAAMDMNLAFTDETHYRYAQSLLKTGQFENALTEFQAVESSFPGSAYFASAAMEAAQLLFQKKSYSQARRVLYELMAARDRLSPADKAEIERAYFFVARCYEAEGNSPETAPRESLSTPVASLAKAGNEASLAGKSTETEGK
jgi:tetratricopeptide (TPR) repeat protein